MPKIISIVGARPNFMKVAPIMIALEKNKNWRTPLEQRLIHTGQHFSPEMSDLFFKELELPKPDRNLGISGGDHGHQTGRIMVEFEPILLEEKPDAIIVVGDVNSTIACALVASKKDVIVIHIEAGLRSGDMTMPEEINRILTDRISNFLFASERSALENLKSEGISDEKVHLVGNVMIDTLMAHKEKALNLEILSKYDQRKKEYLLITLHRPSNVDDPKRLSDLVALIKILSSHIKLVVPLHPRTSNRLDQLGVLDGLKSNENIVLTDPLGYYEFINLMANSKAVVTDSGGIQEESTILKVRCFTARENTERPITIEEGTNQLLPWDLEDMTEKLVRELDVTEENKTSNPAYWDGKAADRIANILASQL